MNIAISNIAWPLEADPEALSVVKALGFDGIEVAPAKLLGEWDSVTPIRAREAKKKYEGLGFSIPAMQGILFGLNHCKLFGSKREQAALASHLKWMADIGHELGAHAMVYGAPFSRRRGDLSIAEATDIALNFFRRLAPGISDSGCALCVEANPTNYNCDFLTHTLEAAQLVKELDDPAIRLQLDAGTVFTNNEMLSSLEGVAGLIGHCHISEPQMRPLDIENPRHMEVSEYILNTKYAGWISVESKMTETWRATVDAAKVVIAKYYVPETVS